MNQPLVFPDKMTPAIDHVLGQTPMDTVRIAHLFRETGEDIPHKMEREHAFVVFWMLRLALIYGESNWREAISNELQVRIARAKVQRLAAAFPDGVPNVPPNERKVLEMLRSVKHAEVGPALLAPDPRLAERFRDDATGEYCLRITALGRTFLDCTAA